MTTLREQLLAVLDSHDTSLADEQRLQLAGVQLVAPLGRGLRQQRAGGGGGGCRAQDPVPWLDRDMNRDVDRDVDREGRVAAP